MSDAVVKKTIDDATDLDVVPGDEYVMIDEHERRAHICCGCDTRNAVIVVNILGLLFYILMVISFSLLLGDNLDYDDDQVQKVMNIRHDVKTGLVLSAFVIGLFCTGTALYGGVKFSKTATAVGGLWYLFEACRSILVYDPIGFAVAIGFSYPHAVFYHEIKNGVMSPENYEKEKICCDCCCTC